MAIIGHDEDGLGCRNRRPRIQDLRFLHVWEPLVYVVVDGSFQDSLLAQIESGRRTNKNWAGLNVVKSWRNDHGTTYMSIVGSDLV